MCIILGNNEIAQWHCNYQNNEDGTELWQIAQTNQSNILAII